MLMVCDALPVLVKLNEIAVLGATTVPDVIPVTPVGKEPATVQLKLAPATVELPLNTAVPPEHIACNKVLKLNTGASVMVTEVAVLNG